MVKDYLEQQIGLFKGIMMVGGGERSIIGHEEIHSHCCSLRP